MLRWIEHGTVRAVIETVDPPHRFAFRWAGPLAEEPHPGNSTLVEFSLRPEGAGTRLRVVETGFRELDMPHPEQRTYAEENTEGWASELDELCGYAARLDA